MHCIILLISVSACLVLGDDGETCKFGEVLTLDPVIKMMCIDGSWKPKTEAEAPKGKGKGKGRIAQGLPGSCEDDPSLAANGTCAKDRSHCLQYTIKGVETNLNCAGTCNACDTCRCQDHAQWHPYCPFWAKYCNIPGLLGTWMSSNCKKSCHKCSCKCCSYQGKQHSLGAKILLPDKCSFLECREGLADNSSPLIPGAATHKIQHPEELTFEFVTLFDGAECCVLTGDGLGEDGIRYPNGSIIPEGWKGIMEKDNGAWINVTCCHGILCVALNDVASFMYSNTTPTTSSTTPTTTTSTTATTKTTTKTTTTTTSTTSTTTTTTLTTTTTTTYNDGWVLVQKRGQYGNSEDYFAKTFQEYVSGFGSKAKEYWMGLDDMYSMTKVGKWALRVKFVTWTGENFYATFNAFAVGQGPRYQLSIGEYDASSNMPEFCLAYHNQQPFSTIDKDQDTAGSSCSQQYGGGGWWFRSCCRSNLNGLNRNPDSSHDSKVLSIIKDGNYTYGKKTMMEMKKIQN